jgi:hypothetical protein
LLRCANQLFVTSKLRLTKSKFYPLKLTKRSEHPNALEVRNIEIEWLFAVEELAMSLNGIDIPNNSLGKVFVNRREPRLETTTSVSEVSTHD